MARKSDNYNAVVKVLSSYVLIRGHIEFLELKLSEVTYNDGLSSVRYDSDFASKTNKITRIVEETAIKNIEYTDLLKQQIKLYNNKIKLLETSVSYLKPVQQKIVKMRYFDKLDWNHICETLLYSRGACYKHHEQAIEQLDTLLYGSGLWVSA